MVDLATILAGLSDAFSLYNLLFVLFGVVLGQFVGAVPGIGPIMAMAIAIPFTFGLDTLPAIAFLVGVNKGGLVGGAVPAVLMNTPGTPDAAATALDGYPLAKQGKPLKATKMALFSSVTGDTFSDIVLITISAPLAVLALKMGPIEIVALMIFAFSILAGLIGNSLTKGIISAALGLLVASIGTDPENFTPRLIFGYWDLFNGLPLPSVAIGMLAISEILHRLSLAHGSVGAAIIVKDTGNPDDRRVTWVEYWSCRYTMLRGAVIGTVLGALPGIGSTAAAFMSYSMTKAGSKEPAKFWQRQPAWHCCGRVREFGRGRGKPHSSAHSWHSRERGRSAHYQRVHDPRLATWPAAVREPGASGIRAVRGDAHGQFHQSLGGSVGPEVLDQSCLGTGIHHFLLGLLLCFVGVSMATSGLFGVSIMLIFAVLGYVMASFGYSLVIFIIAFFLGPRFEKSIAQSLSLTNGDLSQVLNSPVAAALLILSLVSVIWFLRTNVKDNEG